MHCHSVRRQFDWILWLDRLIIDAITLPFQACTYWATPSTVDEIIKNVYHLNWIVMPKNLIYHLLWKWRFISPILRRLFEGFSNTVYPCRLHYRLKNCCLTMASLEKISRLYQISAHSSYCLFFVTGATLNLVVSWHVIAIFFASDARWTQSRIFLLSYQPLANAVVTCGTPAQLVKVTR